MFYSQLTVSVHYTEFFFLSACNSHLILWGKGEPFPHNIKCECYFCAGIFTPNMIKKIYVFASYQLVLVHSCLMSNSINREICQICCVSEALVCFCCSMIDDIIFSIHFVSFFSYFFRCNTSSFSESTAV